jgi:serine/threonine protein kinase
MTVKSLSRSRRNELSIARFVWRHSNSPYLCLIHDHFRIPHHITTGDPRYHGVEFDAIVYPTTGTDLRRLSTPGEHLEGPDLPLTPARRKQYIRDLVHGLVELHDLGIVHGGRQSVSGLLRRKEADTNPALYTRHPPWEHRLTPAAQR